MKISKCRKILLTYKFISRKKKKKKTFKNGEKIKAF